MSGTGGFAVSRSHGGDRFYNPPAMRRNHQMHLHQQQQQQLLQLQRATKFDFDSQVALPEAGNRTDSEDSVSALSSQTPSRSSSSPPPTNLDRFLESVTPFVTAKYFSEVKTREQKTRKAELNPIYCLGDLWESFCEWSVYGVGVPLLLNGKDPVKQYYVPFLSGIQLYVDPLKRSSWLRRPGEDSDAESSRETSSSGSSDCEADKQSKSIVDGSWSQYNVGNLKSQQLNRLSLRGKSVTSSSSDEAEINNSPGQLLFEFLEQDQPHNRNHLLIRTEKVQEL